MPTLWFHRVWIKYLKLNLKSERKTTLQSCALRELRELLLASGRQSQKSLRAEGSAARVQCSPLGLLLKYQHMASAREGATWVGAHRAQGTGPCNLGGCTGSEAQRLGTRGAPIQRMRTLTRQALATLIPCLACRVVHSWHRWATSVALVLFCLFVCFILIAMGTYSKPINMCLYITAYKSITCRTNSWAVFLCEKSVFHFVFSLPILRYNWYSTV